MRIRLSPEADEAYQAVCAEVLEVNPFIEASPSRWFGAIILAFHRSMNPKVRDELLQAVSTPESMRRALLRQVEQASLGMDARALRQLEGAIRKLGSPLPQKSEVHEDKSLPS